MNAALYLLLSALCLGMCQARMVAPPHHNWGPNPLDQAAIVAPHKRTPSLGDSSCSWGMTGALDYGRWASDGNSSTNHMSILQPPDMPLHNHIHLQHHELDQNPVLAGEQHCPNIPPDQYDATQPLMVTALCPWYWKLNYDPLRLPASVPEAHCRCKSAVTGHRIFGCEEVTMRLRVLRFDASCKEYRPDTMSVAVSCVSVLQPAQRLDEEIDGVRQHQKPIIAPIDT